MMRILAAGMTAPAGERMRITTTARVWQATAAVNGVGAAVVIGAVLLVYPRADWLFELSFGLALCFGIGGPFTWLMTNRMREINLLRSELQRMVDRDTLTGLASRDHFFHRMEEMPETPGVALMIDIDHFKQVNDTHGHVAGDAVLKHVAALMQDAVRDEDILARFGGEEFLVFLPDTDRDSGHRVAERMREAVAAGPVTFEGAKIEVTISLGGACKRAGDTIEQSIKDADAALYEAKDAGRDRTVLAGDVAGGVKAAA